MILVSPEISAALERNPTVRTEGLDLRVYGELIAGESVIVFDGQRYGVVRYDRHSRERVTATLVLLSEN